MSFDEKTSVLDVRTLPKAERAAPERRSACFIVLTGSHAGRTYKLEREELTIGRGSKATIRIEDDGVSREHAQITQSADGTVAIRDLGSTNGTFCNGEKLASRTLTDGDKIQIGTTTILKFSYQDSIEEDFQRRQYESATRDALTGCFNKKYLLERLPSEIAFASRHDKSLALGMLDIDHFKQINDTYGHLAGDYVLRELAAVVAQQIRADDILARYGGEEFALIMRETSAQAALSVAERVRLKVAEAHFACLDERIAVTISLGIAVGRGAGLEAGDALIKSADSYLYRAKDGGRNRTECAPLE